MADNPQIVYLNGRFVPAEDATVSVFDAGFLHGAGLFETMRSYNGRVFRARQHLERLERSAETFGLVMPARADDLVAAMHELLGRAGLPDARVRLTMTMGDARAAAAMGESQPNLVITAVPMRPHPAAQYEKGVTVLLSPWRQSKQDPTTGHKVTAYMPRLLALRRAQQAECFEAIWFTTDNLLAEGSISNVFLVKGGRARTPPVDTPILPGVTRAAVIEVAGQAGIPLEEQPLTINDLLDADEVFLTGTGVEVMPVVRVEQHAIGGEKVGPISQRVLQLFRELVGRECPG